MNAHLQRKTRLRREWLLTIAIAIGLLAALVFGDLARPMGNVLYDHYMRWHGFRASEDIIIVAIDDRSLTELGGWPLQRSQYTKLFESLDDDRFRPKAIGFDLLFVDPTEDDAALAEQMARQKTVIPLEFKLPEKAGQDLSPHFPVAAMAQAATLGHINLAFDADGVIRGLNTNELQWPSLALALHAQGDPSFKINAAESSYRRFRMVDPRVGFTMVSFSDAINFNFTRSLFKDKYVLVGVTSPSLGDRYPTLYSGNNNASTPGVAILASVLNASLDNALIQESPVWFSFVLPLCALLLILFGLVNLRPRTGLLAATFLIALSVVLTYSLLTRWNFWLDPSPFILVVVLVQPLWAWRRLEAIVSLVQDKAQDLQQLQPSQRSSGISGARSSREAVLNSAHLLDHAVNSARSELDFLSSVVNEIPDAVAIYDEQNTLLLGNQKIKDLFGEALLSKESNLTDLAACLQLPLDKVSQSHSNAVPQPVLQIPTLLGPRDFLLKSAKLTSPFGGNLRLLILSDMTELRQSQTQRDRALQFLSHDMRTPLASILSLTHKSNSEGMSKGTRPNLQREKIIHHANALLEMMDDFILTVSAEAPQYKVQQVLLDNLINDAIEQVADLAEAKGVHIKDASLESTLFVMANTRLLLRALINLIYNAVKFSPIGSTITIEVQAQSHPNAQETHAVITLTNPVEIHAGSADFIPSMPGFGLGLDFVDTVIQKHHGHISREIPTQGTAIVRITLPCSQV